jgi:hypothetical protein
MKTKLLKKVRKRYSITEVTKLASHDTDFYSDFAKKYGLPFYVVNDSNSEYRLRIYKEFEGARRRIIDMAICDYENRIKNKPRKEQKIWYIK